VTNERDTRGRSGSTSAAWALVALLVFLATAAVTFEGLWRHGPSTFVATGAVPDGEYATVWQDFTRADAIFEAWLVARNARTLAHRPWALFDTEHCAPAERTLTLGVPMITMGLLGIPMYLASSEPVLTYNASILLLFLAAAFCAFAVISDWTGEPAAGVVGGLVFGFAALRLDNITHPSVLDIAWTGYALYFARRLLTHGRWRDAIGLAIAGVLQVWASFYTLLAAVFLLPPLGIWLLRRFGLRRVRIAQLALVAGAVLGGALILFPPYLAARESMGILSRAESEYHFAAWSDYLPGGTLYFGSTAWVLGTAALFFRSRTLFPKALGNPRPVLAIAALLVAAISTGPNLLHPGSDTPVRWGTIEPLPGLNLSLYHTAAQIIPGMDAIRVVTRLSVGAHLSLSILAGIGAAGLLRLSGRFRTIMAIALITAAFFDVARPGNFAGPKRHAWTYHQARSSDAAIGFFETLAKMGNHGPLLELPIAKGLGVSVQPPRRIMLTVHHGRRTSSCFGSYVSPATAALEDLSARLPAPEVVAQLRDLGFTTVIVDKNTYWAAGFEARQRRAKSEGSTWLRLLHSSEDTDAYSLGAPTRVQL